MFWMPELQGLVMVFWLGLGLVFVKNKNKELPRFSSINFLVDVMLGVDFQEQHGEDYVHNLVFKALLYLNT